MAYQFAQSPSHSYLRTASAPTSEINMALSLWFKAADVTNSHTLIRIEYDDPDNNRILVAAMGSAAGDPVRLVCMGEGTSFILDTATSYSANVWQHVMVATLFTGDKMWLSLNGAAWVAREAAKWPQGSPSYIQIGGDNEFIPSIIGSVAEVAMWDALAPYESFNPQGRGKPLTIGVDPGMAHPNKPVFHAPLDGRLQDLYGGRSLTAYNGAVPANDHPPVRR